MSTFKKTKVVMLSTNEPSKIGNLATYQKRSLAKVIKEGINPKDSTLQFWNLYIISDDEIKEGDWCIDSNAIIFQHKNHFPISIGQRKIIATTNPLLKIEIDGNRGDLLPDVSFDINLPQPSQQFIQKYIEEYNKGNVITDILVKYELISNEEYFGNTVNPDNDVPYFDEKLKINPKDNTITIKKVKDSYSREEVIEFGNKVKEYCKNGCKPDSLHRVFFEWDKWIEENL